MAEYLSASELSRRSGIPRTTVRRWLKQFDPFFVSDLIVDDSGVERVVYHPHVHDLLCWIKANRDLGFELDEIKTSMIRGYVLHYHKEGGKYADLSSRVENASLWQRIFKKW